MRNISFLEDWNKQDHNQAFSIENLCTLAAKTTCKDRWRQVLNEADRLRDRNKYLCTLQQGISSAQMDEMQTERVILVVPRRYISTYPRDKQERIWTIQKFVQYVKELEGIKYESGYRGFFKICQLYRTKNFFFLHI